MCRTAFYQLWLVCLGSRLPEASPLCVPLVLVQCGPALQFGSSYVLTSNVFSSLFPSHPSRLIDHSLVQLHLELYHPMGHPWGLGLKRML